MWLTRAQPHTQKGRKGLFYLYKGNVFIHSRNRPFTKINVNLVQMGDHMWRHFYIAAISFIPPARPQSVFKLQYKAAGRED